MLNVAVSERFDYIKIKLQLVECFSKNFQFILFYSIKQTDLGSEIHQLSAHIKAETMLIEVRRQFILDDALKYSHKKRFDPQKMIKV